MTTLGKLDSILDVIDISNSSKESLVICSNNEDLKPAPNKTSGVSLGSLKRKFIKLNLVCSFVVYTLVNTLSAENGSFTPIAVDGLRSIGDICFSP
jgi:hypothetical protein